jgi:hypothetical protein
MRTIIAYFLCATQKCNCNFAPMLVSTSPFGSFLVAWKSPLCAQRCMAAPYSRSETRPVFQGEENIPDDKVRSDLTEVAKLVYEHMKLVSEHRPFGVLVAKTQYQDFRFRLQLRLPTHRDGDLSSEPSGCRMGVGRWVFNIGR